MRPFLQLPAQAFDLVFQDRKPQLHDVAHADHAFQAVLAHHRQVAHAVIDHGGQHLGRQGFAVAGDDVGGHQIAGPQFQDLGAALVQRQQDVALRKDAVEVPVVVADHHGADAHA